MPIDLTKPLRTRTGLPVKLLHVLKGEHEYPVQVVVTRPDGDESVQAHTMDGAFFIGGTAQGRDLENIPESTYRLVYTDGHVVPGKEDWEPSKEFPGYFRAGRAGYLVKTNGVITYESI